MKSTWWIGIGLCIGMQLSARTPTLHADEIPAEYRASIHKGLEWLAKQQGPDGHWEAAGGQYPVAMSALSGISFLMQGSTLREGKYAHCIRKVVDWLIQRSMPNGMIGNPSHPVEAGHYMYGHGYAMVFLACVYGDVDDREVRHKLQDILTRAVLFSGKAQSKHGGWTYISAAECHLPDSSSTVTQMQGLRAARNAGIVVPKEIINKGIDYLRKTTNTEGGLRYGWDAGEDGRPALTAAALASAFGAGDYESDLVKRWLQFCQKHIPLSTVNRFGHDEYTHYYLAQIMYILGEDRYARLFPQMRPEDRITWGKYRKLFFGSLMKQQSANGSWSGAGIGTVYTTAMYLTILQLDNGALPMYQR